MEPERLSREWIWGSGKTSLQRPSWDRGLDGTREWSQAQICRKGVRDGGNHSVAVPRQGETDGLTGQQGGMEENRVRPMPVVWGLWMFARRLVFILSSVGSHWHTVAR